MADQQLLEIPVQSQAMTPVSVFRQNSHGQLRYVFPDESVAGLLCRKQPAPDGSNGLVFMQQFEAEIPVPTPALHIFRYFRQLQNVTVQRLFPVGHKNRMEKEIPEEGFLSRTDSSC